MRMTLDEFIAHLTEKRTTWTGRYSIFVELYSDEEPVGGFVEQVAVEHDDNHAHTTITITA